MSVGALERKGADPRRLALKLVRCGVSHRSTRKRHRPHHPRGVDGGGDVRVDTPKVHHARDELTAQGAGGVHEPSRARRTLSMTDVGLDGTEHERVEMRGSARSVAQDPEETADLDRVSERSPGAVHLEAHHVTGRDPAVAQGAGDDVLLGGAVGGGEGAGSAILVDGGPSESDAVLSRRRRTGGEHDDLAPLGAHVAVGGCVQGLAPAVGSEHAGALEHRGGVGEKREVDAAHGGCGALSHSHGARAEMSSDERRRASGVNAEGGALEVEAEREPPGSHTQRRRGCAVRSRRESILICEIFVLGPRSTDVHPSVGARYIGRGHDGIRRPLEK